MVTEEKQVVIDAVIEQLKEDIKQGDFTVLDELLGFVPTKRLICSLPEELWVKYTPPKFVPYIEERPIVHLNGITEYVRKKFRARTAFDWAPPKISFGNFAVEWTSDFDRFDINYWKGEGYLAKILVGDVENPMEYHYGNNSSSFIMNLLRHFPTKELLIANIDRWANYYRKHVTDVMSGYTARQLGNDIFAQRAGLSSGIKQQYFDHTLEEIETTEVKEYYRFSYTIFDDHIDFNCNPVYPSWVVMKVFFK